VGLSEIPPPYRGGYFAITPHPDLLAKKEHFLKNFKQKKIDQNI